MFTTTQKIKEWTGIEVTPEDIRHAQFIVETYIGRIEAEIDNAYDLALLARATTWQAVYMKDNANIVWEQIAVTQAGQNESVNTFDTDNLSPFMHRMAVQACSRLSWKKTRSVRTGPSVQRPAPVRWETD